MEREEALPVRVRHRLERGRLFWERERAERARLPHPGGAHPCIWSAARAELQEDLHPYLHVSPEDVDADEQGGLAWIILPGTGGVCLSYRRDEQGFMRRQGPFLVPDTGHCQRGEWLQVEQIDAALYLSWSLAQQNEGLRRAA